jgi:type VI secretion system secreted protein VgrG
MGSMKYRTRTEVQGEAMQAPSHALRVRSAAIPMHLGQLALEPVRLSGREGLNSLFEYELLLKTPDALNLGAGGAADFELDAFIGREISCLIELDGSGEFLPGAVGASVDRIGAGVREINALITEAALWGEEGRHVQYRLVLRPWLHLASLSTDCKIFQNKTVVEILDELLADYPFAVDKRLVESYPRRDYQTQYNESDLSFFERLCQEWGINYFFEHSEGKHRLVLIDNLGGHKANPSAAYQQVECRIGISCSISTLTKATSTKSPPSREMSSEVCWLAACSFSLDLFFPLF